MTLSEKWIHLRENDIYDLSDKKHSRGEKPGRKASVAFLQKQNTIFPFRFALPAPERMFDLHPAMFRINCNIRVGAFVSIACTHKWCDVLKMYTPPQK